MNKEEMTLEKAEKIVDDMYQSRWEECGVCDGNTVHLGNLDNLQYNELERASILLLKKEVRFRNENTTLKQALKQRNEAIEKVIEYAEKQQVNEKDLYTANVILDLCCDLKEILKGDNNE